MRLLWNHPTAYRRGISQREKVGGFVCLNPTKRKNFGLALKCFTHRDECHSSDASNRIRASSTSFRCSNAHSQRTSRASRNVPPSAVSEYSTLGGTTA